MSRYSTPAGPEVEYEPGSRNRVLRNRLGIKSKSAMDTLEAELLLIHPFREGNGRLARWLANIMFAQAGMTIPDYGFTGRGAKKRREDYLAAVVKGYYRDYSDLTFFFERALERGYAADLTLDSERGDAPSKTEDS